MTAKIFKFLKISWILVLYPCIAMQYLLLVSIIRHEKIEYPRYL